MFRDASANYNSGGDLRLLPLPLSVIACYGGIFLFGEIRRASISIGFIIITCLLMMITTVITSQAHATHWQPKFVLLVQYVLPMFGLVLGQLYESKNKSVSDTLEKAFLYTLVVIVPLQLICSWLQGQKILVPYLYLFSIYQYLQYIPVIFVSAFLVAFCSLWQLPKHRKVLLLLAPIMGIYVAASLSMLALSLLFAGLLGFALYQYKNFLDKTPVLLLLVTTLFSLGYLQFEKDTSLFMYKFSILNESNQPNASAETYEAPPNIRERIVYWKYYAENITSTPETFFIGHKEPPDRVMYPSAHNYYLDFIYNFGMLGLLPMLIALVYIMNMLYRYRREIYVSPSLFSIAAVVLFLVFVDNSLKVGFRQPYPGIIAFFLVGVLIARLAKINVSRLDKLNIKSSGV